MDTENMSYILDDPLVDTLKGIIGIISSKKLKLLSPLYYIKQSFL